MPSPGLLPAGPLRAGDGIDPPQRGLSKRARAALPLETVSRGMVVRKVSVHPSDVVFVKGLVEASDGLAAVFAERGGELLLAAPPSREAELHELLADLAEDLGACVTEPGPTGLRAAARAAPLLAMGAPPNPRPQSPVTTGAPAGALVTTGSPAGAPARGECGRVP